MKKILSVLCVGILSIGILGGCTSNSVNQEVLKLTSELDNANETIKELEKDVEIKDNSLKEIGKLKSELEDANKKFESKVQIFESKVQIIESKLKESERTNEILKNKIENVEKVNKENSIKTIPDLRDFFSFKEGDMFRYEGVLDYGQTNVVKKISEENNILFIDITTNIDDLSGGGSELIHNYEFQYIINDSLVREKYTQLINNPQKPFCYDRIILKKPLAVDNVFTNTFIYRGKEYIGETKINKISLDNYSKNYIITTITTIKDIEHFKNNVYTEINEYEINTGLIYSEFNTPTEGIILDYRLTQTED